MGQQRALLRMGGNQTLINDLRSDKGDDLVAMLLSEAGYQGMFSLMVLDGERGSSATKGIKLGICNAGTGRLEIRVQPGDNGTRKKCSITPPQGENCEKFREKLSVALEKLEERKWRRPTEENSSEASNGNVMRISVPRTVPSLPVQAPISQISETSFPQKDIKRNWGTIKEFIGDVQGVSLFLLDFTKFFSGDLVNRKELVYFLSKFVGLPSNRIPSAFRFFTARGLLKKDQDGNYIFDRRVVEQFVDFSDKNGAFPSKVSKTPKKKNTGGVISKKEKNFSGDISLAMVDTLIKAKEEITSIEEEIARAKKVLDDLSLREAEANRSLRGIHSEKVSAEKEMKVILSRKIELLGRYNLTPSNIRRLEKMLLGKK